MKLASLLGSGVLSRIGGLWGWCVLSKPAGSVGMSEQFTLCLYIPTQERRSAWLCTFALTRLVSAPPHLSVGQNGSGTTGCCCFSPWRLFPLGNVRQILLCSSPLFHPCVSHQVLRFVPAYEGCRADLRASVSAVLGLSQPLIRARFCAGAAGAVGAGFLPRLFPFAALHGVELWS